MLSETNKKKSDIKKESPESSPPSEINREIEDMEYTINLLRIKMGSVMSLPDKMRLYNQIKTLQANIDRLREKRSS